MRADITPNHPDYNDMEIATMYWCAGDVKPRKERLPRRTKKRLINQMRKRIIKKWSVKDWKWLKERSNGTSLAFSERRKKNLIIE